MIRLLGAAMLVAGCGGFGFSLASAQRREARMLHRLISVLQEMEWELKYRMTELPELCSLAADASSGSLRCVFRELGEKLRRREVLDISACFNDILERRDLPKYVRRNLKQLGACLGRFDLEGQVQGLEAVRCQCRQDLARLQENGPQRMRNYQILALCAGAALAILFI